MFQGVKKKMNRTSQQTQTMCVWDAFGTFKCGGSSLQAPVRTSAIERFEANGDKSSSGFKALDALDAFVPTRAPLGKTKETFCGCEGAGGAPLDKTREKFCGCEGAAGA
jgi:hypothetical protein